MILERITDPTNPTRKLLATTETKTSFNRKKLLKTGSQERQPSAVIVSGEGKLSIASIQLTLLFFVVSFHNFIF